MEYKRNNNIIFSCKYHVVWCPKYRRKVLIEGVDERLKELIVDVAVKHQAGYPHSGRIPTLCLR